MLNFAHYRPDMKQMKHKHRMMNLTDTAPPTLRGGEQLYDNQVVTNTESAFAFMKNVPGGVQPPGTFFCVPASRTRGGLIG